MSSKELLAEYATLAAKLRHINETLQEINSLDVVQLIDKIRIVERKMGLVYTLFRSSVYSVLVQEQDQQQASDQQHQDAFQEEEETQPPPPPSASSSMPAERSSSFGLHGSGGEGYAQKDALLSSTGARSEAMRRDPDEYDLGHNPASSSHTHHANDLSTLPSPPPVPLTPSRLRAHHPYHHYRSDPLLESTHRRHTLAAAHAAAAAASTSGQSRTPGSTLTTAPTTTTAAAAAAAAAAAPTAAPHHRTSNVLDQFEAMTGQRSLLSLSRGHARRPYDDGPSTNRPRYY